MERLFSFYTPMYANDLDSLIPEIWAQEALLLLENNMVVANLVHRDFEDEIASFGDVVNTRLPATFEARRKTDDDNVTVQDAVSPNVPVVLNQHVHTSFLIKDGEESKSFQVLRDILLEPAMLSCAEFVDKAVLLQGYDFLLTDGGAPNVVGQLGQALTKSSVLAVRQKMNENKVPMSGRNLILTPEGEADLLGQEIFTAADKVGDPGTALREGNLGMKFGIMHWMSQQTPSTMSGLQAASGEINEANGYAKGATVLTVDGFSAAIQNGAWLTVAGDDTPQRVVATVGGGTPTEITVFPGLSSAVVDDAAVTIYEHALVDQATPPTGYAAGYGKTIAQDTISGAPLTGQLVSTGATPATNPVYGVQSLAPTATAVEFNRPLDAAIADDSVLGYGPDGQYNFAFHRNALALVVRPLAAPASGTGARSFVANFNGLSMRVTITYDGNAQGHLVTCDMLIGIKTLDRRLGCVLLA